MKLSTDDDFEYLCDEDGLFVLHEMGFYKYRQDIDKKGIFVHKRNYKRLVKNGFYKKYKFTKPL